MVRSSGRPRPDEELAAAVGASLAVAVLLGMGVLAAGLAISGHVGGVLAVLACCLPGLVVQDVWRFAFFTVGQPHRAVVNDLVWAIAQLLLMGALAAFADAGVAVLTAAWAGSASLAALFGYRQTRLLPRLDLGVAYVRRHLDLGGRFSVEFLFQSGSTQATMLFVGVIVGSAGVGAVRGGQVLVGPFSVLLIGLTSAAIPEGSRLLARRPERLLPTLRLMSALLIVAAALVGAALLLLPAGVGRALLGDTWPGARTVLPATIALTGGIALTSGALVGLRVLAAARESMRIRIVIGSFGLSCGIVGAIVGDAPGAVWGLAVGSWLLGASGWWTLHRLADTRLIADRCAAARGVS